MKCRECANFDLRSYPKHTSAHMGWCTARGPGVFMNIKRDEDCSTFVKASEEVLFKRMDWLIRKEFI